MRNPLLLMAVGLLLVVAPLAHADEADVTPLNNKDVLLMVQKNITDDVIIGVIKNSPCTFDVFPPVLRDMKRRGVSDAVLQAMIEAPYGPSLQTTAATADELGEQPIYHYTDQLRALGYLAPTTSRRPARTTRQNSRLRTSSRNRR